MSTSPQPPDATSVDDDDLKRVVPTGTWASDGEEPAEVSPEQSSDRLVRLSQPPMSPHASAPPQSAASSRTRSVAGAGGAGAGGVSSSRSGSASASPLHGQPGLVRPPFLASVLMRRRDELREPIYLKRGRALAALGGALACAAAVASHAVDLQMGAFAALAAMLTLSAIIPLPDYRRSLLMVGLGLTTVILGLTVRGSAAGATAVLSVLAASAGLVLRARRIGAWPARLLVGIGFAAAIAWLLMEGLHGAVASSFAPEDLVGPTVTLSFVVVLALALLAFVDDHGPSGGGVFAAGMLAWGVLEAVSFVWRGGEPGSAAAGAIGAAVVVPGVAIALAQGIAGRKG